MKPDFEIKTNVTFNWEESRKWFNLIWMCARPGPRSGIGIVVESPETCAAMKEKNLLIRWQESEALFATITVIGRISNHMRKRAQAFMNQLVSFSFFHRSLRYVMSRAVPIDFNAKLNEYLLQSFSFTYAPLAINRSDRFTEPDLIEYKKKFLSIYL